MLLTIYLMLYFWELKMTYANVLFDHRFFCRTYFEKSKLLKFPTNDFFHFFYTGVFERGGSDGGIFFYQFPSGEPQSVKNALEHSANKSGLYIVAV